VSLLPIHKKLTTDEQPIIVEKLAAVVYQGT